RALARRHRRLGAPMKRRILFMALGATVILICCGGTISFFLSALPVDTKPAFAGGCGNNDVVNLTNGLPKIANLGDDQIRNAAIIIRVGQDRKVPPRGWVIAVATAMQESNLRNLGNLGTRNDHDSLGLFQQRPSTGWGAPEQIMKPEYAAGKFYEKLVKIAGWDRLPLTDAAQAVQISAYPDAYAKHEPLATRVVDQLTNGATRAAANAVPGSLVCAKPGEIAASGWTAPVKAAIVSGFRTPDRPDHYGVDLGAARNTPILAASAGVVVVAKCNVPDGYSCNVDGSPAIGGCGWYVDIRHAGGIITRYCHMGRQPEVRVGQTVAAGQLIGYVGSSGNSSGPHLHFEVHVNGNQS